MNKQTERQADKSQKYIQINRKDILRDKKTKKQTYIQTERKTNRQRGKLKDSKKVTNTQKK